MRALSLWQPWATLIRIGAKKCETRSWGTNYRGPIAIHAAKKVSPDFGEICHSEPFCAALSKAGYDEMECFEFGSIVAIADLVAVKQIVLGIPSNPKKFMIAPADPEYSFGNYEAGLYGWILDRIRPIPEAIPYKGMQGLFAIADEVFAGLRCCDLDTDFDGNCPAHKVSGSAL